MVVAGQKPKPVGRRVQWLLLLAVACSHDSGDPLDPEQPGNPNATLECERVGYPCSLDTVPLDVLRRSQAIADSAVAMLRTSAPAAQVQTWLEQRAGVVEVQGEARALRFRVSGGSPFWIFDDGARPGGAGMPSGRFGAAATAGEVVGDGAADRRALVLSPVAWQFVGFDETPTVAAILGATRGYEGRVQLHAVPSATSPALPLAVFTSWDVFEVVHVSSHGETICDSGVCRATLTAAVDNRPLEQVQADWGATGVSFSIGTVTGNRYVNLDADFFRHHYPNGVGNTLVYLSACQTLASADTDLADAIRGSKGVFLGWSDAVQSGPAASAAVAFYTRLKAGVTVGTAHADIGPLAVNQWADDAGYAFNALLRVTERQEGGDLRVRDIVWLENPAGGAPLTDGGVVAITGAPADGVPDTIPYRIRVDGVDAAPADFTVRVEIAGVASPPTTLAAAEPAGEGVRVLTGRIALGRDLQEGETVQIRATVELPDEGTSQTSAVIGVSGDRGRWEGKAVFIREGEDFVKVAESTDLRFEYDASAGRYYLASGTLTWFQAGRTLGPGGQVCTYETQPMNITLPARSAFIVISHATSPARYSLSGSYEGPQITVPTSCPGWSTTVRLNGLWLRTSNGINEILEDGTLMEGYYEEDVGFLVESWAWQLRRTND